MNPSTFFEPARRFTVGEIAVLCGAQLATPALASNEIDGVAPADDAGDGKLVFVDAKNRGRLEGLRAAAVIVPAALKEKVPEGVAILLSEQPQVAFAGIARQMFPSSVKPVGVTGENGISPQAHIHPTAKVEDGATIEAGAVVGAHAAIGSGTVIAANAVIGSGCQIGRDCYVGPGASVLFALVGNAVFIHPGARIGQDGFGYVPGARAPEKVPQIGRVVIQDNVEIGANSTIDRGAMADTVIGEHTKIDNLVQIGHNVRIGRACLIAGQCGISGSCVIGDGVMMGGGVGLADHLTIGSGARLAAGSGFMTNVPAGEVWAGYPAQPMSDLMREIASVRRLSKRPAKAGA